MFWSSNILRIALKLTVEPPVSGHPRLMRGVRLWEVKNVVFVCSWEHEQVSAYERCPPTEGVR